MHRLVAPTVHCVRHAEGFHNLTPANHVIHDPSLTPKGKEQCRILAQNFPYHDSVEALVASPLRRTIYTTLLSFQLETDKGMKVIALPEAQETSDLPCDTGSDPAVLQDEFKGRPVDLGLVHDGWNSNIGKWGVDATVIEKRAKEVRQWLKARPEKEVVLVTHGGFLHYLTGDWGDSHKLLGTGWENTECRSYTFPQEDADNATMEETSASREMRCGIDKPLDPTEQMELRRSAHKSWEQSGFSVQSKV